MPSRRVGVGVSRSGITRAPGPGCVGACTAARCSRLCAACLSGPAFNRRRTYSERCCGPQLGRPFAIVGVGASHAALSGAVAAGRYAGRVRYAVVVELELLLPVDV
jgi:hypothetical protein